MNELSQPQQPSQPPTPPLPLLPPQAGHQPRQPRVRLHVRMFLVLASLPLLLFLALTGFFLLRGMDSILHSTASIRNTYLPAMFSGHRIALDVENLRRHALTVYMTGDPELRRKACLTARAMAANSELRNDPLLRATLDEAGDLLQSIEIRREMAEASMFEIGQPLLQLETLLTGGAIPADIAATDEWEEWRPARLAYTLYRASSPQSLRVMLARMQTFIDRQILPSASERITTSTRQTMSQLLDQAVTARIQALEAEAKTRQLWQDTEQRLSMLRDKLSVASFELTYGTLNSIDDQATAIEHLIYISVALVLLTLLVMFVLLHMYIVRPIIRTSNKLQDIRTGQSSPPLEPIRIAELNEVSALINTFSEQLSVMYQHARNLEREKDHITNLAITDALTGIYNRRYFDIQYKLLNDESLLQLKPLSVVMLDIDLFKVYNDTLGHPAGDECLIQVARAVRGSLMRTSDRVFRYGGEEFVVLLPDCPPEAARTLAERIRSRVQEMGIIHPGSSVSPVVTVSIGVATSLPEAPLFGTPLLDLADSAMYRSKSEGRNRVSVAVSAADHPSAPPTPSTSEEAPCAD